MILNEFYSKSLQETLQEFDLTDVKVHTTDSGKIASIELKYSEKPVKEEETPHNVDTRFGRYGR